MARGKEGINEKIFKALKISEKSNVPVLILSNPGMGKTTTVQLYAKLRNMELVTLRGNSETPETILGYDTAPSKIEDDKVQAAKHLRPSWFEKIKNLDAQGKQVLLFLDEITTSPELVQAALLHLIFERTVGEEELPKNTIICAAGNYASNLTTSMQMLAPTMNRFCIVNITPDISDLKSFLCRYKGAGIGKASGEASKKSLELKLKQLDDLEKGISVDEAKRVKIGEKFESVVLQCAEMLNSEGKVDLRVGDLSQIYADAGTKVFGFLTPRTAGYLVECAIATYLCFGREGITGDFFREVCDGLCGLGLTMKTTNSDVDVESHEIGDRFFQSCQQALDLIEILGNDVIADLEGKLKAAISAGISNKGTSADVKDMNLVLNKLEDLNVNPDTKDLMHPLQDDTVADLISYLITSSAIILPKTDANIADKAEELVKIVSTWNTFVNLTNSVAKFLKDRNYNRAQDEATIKAMNKLLKTVGLIQSNLRNLCKIAESKSAVEVSLTPNIKVLDYTKI